MTRHPIRWLREHPRAVTRIVDAAIFTVIGAAVIAVLWLLSSVPADRLP